VPGRAQRVDCGQPFVVLNDFAHTPDALERMLHAARELTTGKLHILFGCGGDRDRGKRPEMGRIAAALADRITVTSDNPRTENPGDILDQIVAPIGTHDGLLVEVDRTAAIAAAIGIQKAGDTLIVAGKGHERYQIIGTTKHSYDDAEVLRNELRRSGYGQ
jgi:UDP-N-acetylmuramoyl-L-alanyl-D-glutamate--2,6-diaminopimelate ligase